MTNEIEVINKYLPASIKEAIATHQMHKVASQITGLNDFSLAKISEYLGGRIAARRLKWGPVADGLVALHNLTR
jgi:hypothetical protein